MEKGPIIKDNYIPSPPVGDTWRDERRDHLQFQLIVSLAAQLGGVSFMTGCPTPGAEQARRDAEQQYYRSQEIRPKLIIKLK